MRPLGLDDYPVQAEPPADAVTLSAAAVGEALRQVVRAASTDDARAVLTGVLLAAEDDGLRMVATDSYRLAVRDLPETDMLLERPEGARAGPGAERAAARARRHGASCSVRLGERDAVFEVGGTRLTTRLIEGEFPNYRNLLPSSHPNMLTVGREALLEAMRRVKILAQRRHAGAAHARRRHARSSRRSPRTSATPSEEIDATLRGHRDDRGLQPRLPRRRRRRRSTPRRSRCRRWTR